MGLIPAKCWAFFLFSLSFSNISLIRSLNVLQARLLSLPKNGNFPAQLRVKQAKYANEYFCTLWLNGCGKKALNRCRWSKKGCLRAFREDQRKESTNELKKLFKKWKTSGKHSMNEWMNGSSRQATSTKTEVRRIKTSQPILADYQKCWSLNNCDAIKPS